MRYANQHIERHDYADSREIAYAVLCGCTTATRLAQEWGVSKHRARRCLAQATRDDLVVRCGYGLYRIDADVLGIAEELS